MNLGVILLGAGASTRMGRPKLLLPWNNTTVIGHLVETWRNLWPAQLAVVCPEESDALQTELDRIGVADEERIFNPHPEQGMFSSIQSAARWDGWREDITHFAVSLGDQPLVRPETLRGLIDFADQAEPHSVCQPSRAGSGRHPVILPAYLFFQLGDSPAPDLKHFLSGRISERWETDDAGLDVDLDEPADYEKALALAQQGGPKPQ